MTRSRLSLFVAATALALGALAGSASTTPAHATDWSWLSNDNYVRCLQYVRGLSHGDDAAYNRGRKACNRQYYPNKPGVDY
jgi:hypothetical protein